MESAIERLYDLHVGTTPVEEGTPHERPRHLRSCDLTVASSLPPPSHVAEEKLESGCSRAFHRLDLAIHDHPRAACGRLIDLAASKHVPFIVAHLIPFSESQNDHPTNGLALCKNHHWAMNRNLIAPAPDHHWHVSKVLDPRRSNGEKELMALFGQSLLLPQEAAFHLDEMGLRYQLGKLIA